MENPNPNPNNPSPSPSPSPTPSPRPPASAGATASDVKVDDDTGKDRTPWGRNAETREMNTEAGVPSGNVVHDPALVGTARAVTSAFETGRSQSAAGENTKPA